MDHLILTLGHNSSAVLVRNGNVICGYEQERFSGIKSDSAYPRDCIEAIDKLFALVPNTQVYIGHWFLDGQIPTDSKYMNFDHLKSIIPDCTFHSIDTELTHHDSHLQSAMVFAGDDFVPEYHAFVLDGFGTHGECISVYKVNGKSYELVRRWYGFHNSLGMFYQYATAYMGMKQHNHEYKILAYEVKAVDYDQSEEIKFYAMESGKSRFEKMFKSDIDQNFDPVLSVTALPAIQMDVSEELDEFCDIFMIDKDDELEFRSSVSLYVQTLVETVTLLLINSYNPQNVLLAGGLFYNVKLNSLISKQVPGKTCIMPLAGDQGAGLGIYQAWNGDLNWPDNLNWGVRDLNFTSDVPGVVVVDTMSEAMPILVSEIFRIGFVNLVRGNMEFGPRALCNTSTLAMPLACICEQINVANGRTTEMPMAPVVTKDALANMFGDVDKIHKSLNYMVVTRDYTEGASYFDVTGASHHYPDTGISTGRPQLCPDRYIERLLEKFGGILINTSFNYHGIPIVMNKEQIEYTHKMQNENLPNLGITTVVVRGV